MRAWIRLPRRAQGAPSWRGCHAPYIGVLAFRNEGVFSTLWLKAQLGEALGPHLEDVLRPALEDQGLIGHPLPVDPHRSLLDLAVRLGGTPGKPPLL